MCGSAKKWSGPLRRVELDPEPPVKSGRPAPTFRLSRCEPKSAAGHAHGPSDSGTRRFSIGSKDRRVQSPALQANSKLHSSKFVPGKRAAKRIVSTACREGKRSKAGRKIIATAHHFRNRRSAGQISSAGNEAADSGLPGRDSAGKLWTRYDKELNLPVTYLTGC